MEFKNRTVKIFNTSYRILYVKDIKSDNHNRTIMGETDYNLKTIKIRTLNREGHSIPEQEILICLLHELMHAILLEGQYLSCAEDEPLVEWLARCIKSLKDLKVI